MEQQELKIEDDLKVGDKVRWRMGGGICTPNYPKIPMTVTEVKTLPNGTILVRYTKQWYYDGWDGLTESKWLELDR